MLLSVFCWFSCYAFSGIFYALSVRFFLPFFYIFTVFLCRFCPHFNALFCRLFFCCSPFIGFLAFCDFCYSRFCLFFDHFLPVALFLSRLFASLGLLFYAFFSLFSSLFLLFLCCLLWVSFLCSLFPFCCFSFFFFCLYCMSFLSPPFFIFFLVAFTIAPFFLLFLSFFCCLFCVFCW